jgi:hypothetical protein
MAIEKAWLPIAPRLLTSNGKKNGEIQLSTTKSFRVGMIVLLSSNSLPTPKSFKIKRIIDNKVYLGSPDKNILHREDMTGYLLADAAVIWANEQEKAKVPFDDQEMASWEHEPINGRRVFLIDEEGNPYGEDNPVPTTAQINLGSITFPTADTPTIVNMPMANANTEYSFSLPIDTKKFLIKLHYSKPAVLSIATTSGGDTFDLTLGDELKEDNVNLTNPIIFYVKSNKPAVRLDIFYWT